MVSSSKWVLAQNTVIAKQVWDPLNKFKQQLVQGYVTQKTEYRREVGLRI